MQDFEQDLNTMQGWPVLEGKNEVAAATRAAKKILEDEDLYVTMRSVYCDLPLSPVFRGASRMLIKVLDAEIKKTDTTVKNDN